MSNNFFLIQKYLIIFTVIKLNTMKKLLFTLALLLSFNSYSQTWDDILENNWSERSVRAFYDSYERPLKNIEGIYTGDFNTYYKVAIFYYKTDDVYIGYVLETNSPNKNWRRGDTKIKLEESAIGGDFDVKWYHPAKRNKKGIIKKSGYFYRAGAIEILEGQSIEFTNGYMNSNLPASGTLIKTYPKL